MVSRFSVPGRFRLAYLLLKSGIGHLGNPEHTERTEAYKGPKTDEVPPRVTEIIETPGSRVLEVYRGLKKAS